MIILASPKVFYGKPINVIAYLDSCWFVLNNSDLKQGLNPNLEDFEFYSEELLYNRIPFIKGKLQEENETLIIIDEKTGKINVNPKHKHWGISTNDEVRATNQANFPISFLSYFKNRKIYTSKILLISILLSFLSFTISIFFLTYLIRLLIFQLLSRLNERNMYLSGTLNPSIVISTLPTRIAVLTNLSKFNGSFPLIRVKKVELPISLNKVGQRIAVAGTYQTNSNKTPYWDFYKPLPLVWGAKKIELAEKKVHEIPIYEWISLNKELKVMDKNLKEGYYPIQISTSDWNSYPNPKFVQLNDEK